MSEEHKMPEWVGNQLLLCPHCGAKNSMGATLCSKCGKPTYTEKKYEVTEK